MDLDFRQLFRNALRDESQVLRPYFFPDEYADPQKLVAGETYLRLRLARMFLRHRRELFTTQYPVLHALIRFAGLDGQIEVHYVARPELAGNGDPRDLDQVVALDQTLLGPILYRGGDLTLVLGLYAAPADDWAQRFIGLAEGISQMTVNATLTAAVSMASTVKQALENTLGQEGLPLKLGVDQELKENVGLAPGYLVMIAAPEDELDRDELVVEEGELLTRQGRIYREHDYIVLALEVSSNRSDWQALGYGRHWQSLLKTAANADDVERVKEAYLTFAGAIMSSEDLSWADRSAIVTLAQKRVQQIRDARAADDFLSGLRGGEPLAALMVVEEEEMEEIAAARRKPVTALMATDWLG